MKIILLILLLFANIAFANEGDTNWRTITTLGCHLNDGTCYFTIDGESVGAANCLGNNIRFDVIKNANGRTWLSLIEAAYITGRKMRFQISGCYSFQPVYPTFVWGQIAK